MRKLRPASAHSHMLARLQAEKCFLPRTCCGKKRMKYKMLNQEKGELIMSDKEMELDEVIVLEDEDGNELEFEMGAVIP